MENVFDPVIAQCRDALDAADPQRGVEAALLKAAADPAIIEAISTRSTFSSLEDLAIYCDRNLTLLAGSLPPGFKAGPHNHNLWSVVSVCAGQEDNAFFARDGDGLRQTGTASVVAPGVLSNTKDVIHAISNPLDSPLVVLHAYGGDLFKTARSSWDPATLKEASYDWESVRSQRHEQT